MKYIIFLVFSIVFSFQLLAQEPYTVRINAIEPKIYDPINEKVIEYGKSPLKASLTISRPYMTFKIDAHDAPIQFRVIDAQQEEGKIVIYTKQLRNGQELDAIWILFGQDGQAYAQLYSMIGNIETLTTYYIDLKT